MPIYQYRAYSADEKVQKGTHDAGSEREVRQYLRSNNLYPIEIKQNRFSGNKKLPRTAAQGNAIDWKKWLPFRKKYNKQVAMMSRQLETLLTVGIPYDKALEMIIGQTTDPVFKSMLSDIRSRVMEGSHLADAMEQYPDAFPAMYVSMVRAGENSGTLDEIVRRLANYYEEQEKLRSKLKSSMTYPIFMIVFSLGVVAFMMLYIVPKITAVFDSRGASLPLPTKVLINLSDFMTNHWLLLLLIIAGSMSGMAFYFRSKSGRKLKDNFVLKAPVVKNLVIKVMVLRFCQTLGTLLKSGVDLKSSLEISKYVVVNEVMLVQVNQLIVDVNNKGIPLSSAMRRIPYFPEYVCHVVAIGEQAAKVDELLERVAERMQMEVSNSMEGLTSLLQPAMIMIMGGIIGFIAVAIMLPMMTMNQIM